MMVFLDGAPIYRHPVQDGPGFSVRLLPPQQVEAIEVYRSVAARPVEFNTTGSKSCLVLIWTRR